MRVLLDTNILLRAAEREHSQHSTAVAAIDTLIEQEHELCLVPQCIQEFWVVATRPKDVNGLSREPDQVVLAVQGILRSFTLLRDERAIFERWFELVTLHEVRGIKAYDTRLVAAMLRHGIDQLLTFNGADFKRYTEISVIDPATIASGTA